MDVLFKPNSPEAPPELGLLGRFCQTVAIFEPYHNPVTSKEIRDCLSKLFLIYEEIERDAKRNKKKLAEHEIPRLWILTPTASSRILEGVGAQLSPDWASGIYFLPSTFRTAIVVIHQLPETTDTLWLRLLGRGRKREKAIDDLEALPTNNPLKANCLDLLYDLTKNLEAQSSANQSQENRRLIMRLAPLYRQEKEQAIQQEASKLVLRQINRRIGEIPEDTRNLIQGLSVEQLEDLGEALLDFESLADLDYWLNSVNT